MHTSFLTHLRQELASIESAGLYKHERIITSPQGADISVKDGASVLNFCANNYLGLSSHPAVIDAAKATIDERGYGLSSVRFICGTQDIHKELEAKLSEFLHTEDTILYAAAFDANGGVFEPLLGRKMPSFQIRLTMPLSLMGCDCARQSAFAMPTMTWQIWKDVYRKVRIVAPVSS